MMLIDADKFLAYLIFSKHIDKLTCSEAKEAIEMCKVDILDKIKADIEEQKKCHCFDDDDMYIYMTGLNDAIDIVDKYKVENGDKK